jgi:hypothetical protein
MKRGDLTKPLVGHAETLRDLRLGNVRLSQNPSQNPNSDTSSQSEGPRVGLLHEIRNLLHLTSIRFKGCLYETGPEWELNESLLWRTEEDSLGEAVARFLMHGGRCPLLIAHTHLYLYFDPDDNHASFHMKSKTEPTSSTDRFF